ncbi:MAG TPA: Maf family protein [Candidatus Gastranaerophilales bacterium]|nr:Maf family protein [Candidatus Gastranaerophilales bacterium]
MTVNIILASASPRRKALLQDIGLKFKVIPSDIDENIENKPFSYKLIENIALEKVMDVSKKVTDPAIIIGSDTVVEINNQILGKPKNDQDAFNMLKMLAGKTHKVVSAIVVYDTETKKTIKDSVTSEVTFREITDEEIWNYVKTGEPADKAGAYAIQGKAAIFVKNINGCYSNIVGISLFKTAEILEKFGVNIL